MPWRAAGAPSAVLSRSFRSEALCLVPVYVLTCAFYYDITIPCLYNIYDKTQKDKYHFIGYVTMDAVEEGYYDAEGNPTRKLDTLEALFKEAYAKKDYKEEQQKKYPGCNSSYKAGKGGRVWCADNKLVPRKGA